MKEGASLDWQIALVILNDVPTETYDLVKQWGNQKLGLTTQCISFQLSNEMLANIECVIRRPRKRIRNFDFILFQMFKI